MSALLNLTGQVFGRLTAIERNSSRGRFSAKWVCICVCGKRTVVSSDKLRSGHTQSCGCLRIERATEQRLTHGASQKGWTPEYRAWVSMKTRCKYKNRKDYKHYGGRGISVCERWQANFQNFLDDVGLRPTPGHSIDRIDVNGNYEPSNIRWATASEQVRNRRRSPGNRRMEASV